MSKIDPLEYVINRMENAARQDQPHKHGYGKHRQELIDGIRALRTYVEAAGPPRIRTGEKMSKIEEIKAEFEGVEIEWRLHKIIHQMFAYVEAAEAWFVELECALDPKLTKARRALGLE